MNITIEDLSTITKEVLTAVAGLTPTESSAPTRASTDQWLTGKIQINGKSSSELVLTCTAPLAARLAAAFFGETVSEEESDDATCALLELTNIMAGHVNALMAAPSRITLPQIEETVTSDPSATEEPPELLAAYTCDGEALVVTLRQVAPGRGLPT